MAMVLIFTFRTKFTAVFYCAACTLSPLPSVRLRAQSVSPRMAVTTLEIHLHIRTCDRFTKIYLLTYLSCSETSSLPFYSRSTTKQKHIQTEKETLVCHKTRVKEYMYEAV